MATNLRSMGRVSPQGNDGLDYDKLAAALLERVGVEGAYAAFAGSTTGKFDELFKLVDKRVSVGDQVDNGVVRGAGVANHAAIEAGGHGLSVGMETGGVVEAEKGRRVVEVGAAASDFGVIPESEGSVSGDSEQSVQSSKSVGSMSGGVPATVSEGVRRSVVFGTLNATYGEPIQKSTETPGYFASTGTRDVTKKLAAKLRVECGVKVPKAAMVELGICTYAAGCMPAVVADGGARLRSLAAIGDATITQHLVVSVYQRGETVASAQSLRSKFTSNSHLRKVMMESGLVEYVTFPAGVHPESATTTATAFEAIVGVMAQYMTVEAVARFLKVMKVVI